MSTLNVYYIKLLDQKALCSYSFAAVSRTQKLGSLRRGFCIITSIFRVIKGSR